jgi:hypothetical protein
VLRERPALLDCDGPEPRFEVYRFDTDAGTSAWMIACASELTEDETADLSAEERDLVRASLAVDDPTIGAVHNGEPQVETLAECMEAASAA